MAAAICLTCSWERETGRIVDDSITNVEWSEEVGVSEASIRRHRRHQGESSAERPSGASPGSVSEDSTGKREFTAVRDRPVTAEDVREWLRSSGDDPDDWNYSFRSIAYGEGLFSNKLSAWPKREKSDMEVSLSELYAEVRATPASPPVVRDGNRALVVALADWQLGKTGRRGGTKETLMRLEAAREELLRVYDQGEYTRIVLMDLGDGIEGFESGGDPQFTNDLSLPDQLDCYATEVFKFVRDAYDYSEVEVAAVPSNHSAWRRGKQNLGKPSDDFGLYVHRQVAKVCQESGREVQWHLPDEYDESVLVDVLGTPVGAVHGNQFGPGKAIDWWQAQAFGSQAITKADICLSGHYHSFGAGVAGINPFTDRERMWLGCPTVDSGSDWYRAIRGRDSLPGTLTFEVDAEGGFDLGSLRII